MHSQPRERQLLRAAISPPFAETQPAPHDRPATYFPDLQLQCESPAPRLAASSCRQLAEQMRPCNCPASPMDHRANPRKDFRFPELAAAAATRAGNDGPKT